MTTEKQHDVDLILELLEEKGMGFVEIKPILLRKYEGDVISIFKVMKLLPMFFEALIIANNIIDVHNWKGNVLLLPLPGVPEAIINELPKL